MKFQLSKVNRLSTLMILFGSVGALMFSSVPSVDAAGMNTPSVGNFPDPAFFEGLVTITMTPDPSKVPVKKSLMNVRESGNGLPIFGITSFPAACILPGDSIATRTTWGLQRGGVPVEIFLPNANSQFMVTFGDGLTPTVTLTNGANVTPLVGTYDWVPLSGINTADNLDILTPTGEPYIVTFCGYDGTGDAFFANINTFDTQLSVGGTSLALDTSALILAGLSSSAMWLVPVVGVTIAGIGMYIQKKKFN